MANETWTRAYDQVVVWIESLFMRLKQLSKDPDNVAPLPVPVIIVEGFEWYVLVVLVRSGKTLVLGQVLMRDTRLFNGFMGVLAGLHWLIYWACTT